jgi:hypothetical protein
MNKTDHNPIVRRALDKARVIQSRHPKTPKLDAIVAVLNADNVDRIAGITFPGESTPGSVLAARIAA